MPEAPLRVLCAAFAVVPGSSAHAPAMFGLAAALHASMDFVTLKAEALPHLERFGQAQMLRVPVGGGTENAQRSAFSRAIRRQMESESYDVVHVRGPIEGLVGLEMRATQGFKLIYEMGSYPDESDGLAAERGWAAAHVTCLEGADLVIVPSEAATRAAAVRSRATKLHIVQPGVDVDVYDWRAFVREPGAPTFPRLLYLGSFGADRDLGTLLGAVREVARRIPVRVLLAGEPDPGRRQRVRRLVAAFDLGDVVEVRGEPPPLLVPQIIAAADICLAPAAASPRFQEHGDVPQPLLEYFAGRRPVVAAGVPAVSEVLRDEHEGLLYPPGDQDALTESIVALLEDPALREHTAAQGYERARTQLSAGARRRKLVEVYEALVPGSQRRDPWTTGFDNEGTGQWEIPALGSEATSALVRDSAVPHTAPAPAHRTDPQETEVLLTVRDPMSSPAPARSVTPGPLDVEELRFDARFDTSPGGESGDIAGAPTVIRQRDRADTIPGMIAVTASSERETGETGTDGSEASEALPPTNPGTPSGAGDTAQFVVAPPEREPDTGSVRLPPVARPPASTPPPRGSVPPPAHGSAPPPARGSAPPPAHGSAPPPARGSVPPPPPLRPRSMPPPPSLARKPGAPPPRAVPPPKKPAGG